MSYRRLFVLTLLLVSCGTSAFPESGTSALATPTPLFLITVGDDATPTSTPFQPGVEETLSVLPTIPGHTPTPFSPSTFDPQSLLPPPGTPVSFYAPPYAPQPATILTDDQTITFLLLGSDQRSATQTYFRTDILIVAALRPESMQVSLISLPRDLYVYIPDVGMDRINTAYEYGIMNNYPGGGAGMLKDTILYNLGVRIDHMAIVDFDGFRKIVDTLGGVDVPVSCAYTDWRLISPELDPENENNWSLYTVNPGVIHMDGDLALWYARSRSRSSDYDRGRRSQEVLRSLYARAITTQAITKIPELYEDLNSSVITDLDLADLLSLAPLALEMSSADIRSYYVGRDHVSGWMTPGGASVLLPNGPAIQSLLQKALAPREQKPEQEGLLVEVRNGSNNPGWDSLAAERLNYAGYETRLVPADRQDVAQTLIYDLSLTPNSGQAGELLFLLGLAPEAYISAPTQGDIPFVLLLGADYQPCFDPATTNP